MPNTTKPLPLTMKYNHKWQRDGQACQRKARCSARGDLMRAGQHYDLDRTQCTTADKSTARFLFAIAAAHDCKIEHMDIGNAYVHKPAMCTQPVFVQEIPRSSGEYKYGQAIGRLKKLLGWQVSRTLSHAGAIFIPAPTWLPPHGRRSMPIICDRHTWPNFNRHYSE